MKNHKKIFWFTMFHIKLCLVQNHCELDKVDGFIIVYDETKCLKLIGCDKYDTI